MQKRENKRVRWDRDSGEGGPPCDLHNRRRKKDREKGRGQNRREWWTRYVYKRCIRGLLLALKEEKN